METFFVMAMFFVFVTLIFVVICIFLPEWVGITGKKALEVIEHQQGTETATSNKIEEKDQGNQNP